MSYEWEDIDGDVKGVLEPWQGTVPHPSVLATLKIAGGPEDTQIGIYIGRHEADGIMRTLIEARARLERFEAEVPTEQRAHLALDAAEMGIRKIKEKTP